MDSRAFPLFTYDPGGASPSPSACRYRQPGAQGRLVQAGPTGTQFDFLSFARTEGRFAATLPQDGTPSPEIQATQADRLANWHTLQEMAGIKTGR